MREVSNLKMLYRYVLLFSSEQIYSECEFFFIFKQFSLPYLVGTTIIKTFYFVHSLSHSLQANLEVETCNNPQLLLSKLFPIHLNF